MTRARHDVILALMGVSAGEKLTFLVTMGLHPKTGEQQYALHPKIRRAVESGVRVDELLEVFGLYADAEAMRRLAAMDS